jgi:hypothetical protein
MWNSYKHFRFLVEISGVGESVGVIQCAWVGVNECGYVYVCGIDTDVSVDRCGYEFGCWCIYGYGFGYRCKQRCYKYRLPADSI